MKKIYIIGAGLGAGSITEDAKKRRSTYQMMEKMKNEEEHWDGDIDDFLSITVGLYNFQE